MPKRKKLNLNPERTIRHLGQASLAVMIALVALALFPSASKPAQAAETESTGIEIPMTVTATPFLAVSLSGDQNIALDINPTLQGKTGHVARKLTVLSNDTTKYNLFVSTANGEQTLAHVSANSAAKIEPVSGEKTLADFDANTWGYALGQGIDAETASYVAVPGDTSTPAKQVDSTSQIINDEYDLAFGAKVSASLPAGQYMNTVNVSVIASIAPRERALTINYKYANGGLAAAPAKTEPVVVGNSYSFTSPTIAGYTPDKSTITGVMGYDGATATVTYSPQYSSPADITQVSEMQQMTSAICNATTVGTASSAVTKDSVRDIRDNELYSIARLADGKCWMVKKNLNLKLSTTKPLTPADSDVPSDWWPVRNTGTARMEGSDPTYFYSWSNWGGTIFHWNAATAGQGASLTVGDATQSVCPREWRLPSVDDYQGLQHTYYTVAAIQASPAALNALGGYFTSHTRNCNDVMIMAMYDSESNIVIGGASRDYDSYVRCIAR